MDFYSALQRQAAVNASLQASAPAVGPGMWSPYNPSAGVPEPYLGGSPTLGVSRPPPTLYAEVERIISLPTVNWLSPAEEENVNRRHILAHVFENRGCGCGCVGRLFNVQANGIYSYERYGGLLGIIAVGWGKTLICIICANLALRKGLKRVVYMCPAGVAAQLWDSDIPWARQHVPVQAEFINLHKQGNKTRRGLVRQEGKSGVWIFPYSLLSAPDAFELLQWINPDLIICDEAHKLGDATAARTKRWLTFVNQRQPEVVALSGGITSKGPKDYAHLAFHSLKDNCPLPTSAHLMNDWQAVLGSRTEADSVTTAMATHLAPVLDWARTYFPHMLARLEANQEGYRTAFQARLTTAPAVIATGDAELTTALYINNEWAKDCRWLKNRASEVPGWAELEVLFKQVDVEEKTPNGDLIAHAIHKFKWLEELAAGFYNLLTWPPPEVFAKRRGLDLNSSEKILQGAQDHHVAKQQYTSHLAKWFGERHRPGLDTPMLVGRDMQTHGPNNVGHQLWSFWDAMKRLQFDGMPERDGKAIRVCPYVVWAAVEWAREFTQAGKGGIIFCKHIELGSWVFEGLQAGGVTNAVYCPAGNEFNDLLNINKNPSIRTKCVVANLAHAEGKNLQYMENVLVLQWPRPAKLAQQLLGRLHRNGQKADEVIYHTLNVSEFHHQLYAACLIDALYIQQTTGDRQKVIMANYDPLPKLYSPAFLRERGFENHMISDRAMTNLRGTVPGAT